MSKSDTVSQFLEVLRDPNKDMDIWINILVNPSNQDQLKFYSKAMFFSIICLLREEYNKTILTKIAKFITMAIMTGHFHILCLIDRYLLPELTEISSGVLKFTPLSPTKSNLVQVQPSKWRIQFASELLYLLSEWFPIDLINNNKQSKYAQIVKNKKIIIKAYFLFTYHFIKKVEKTIQTMNLQEGGTCIYCVKYCDKIRNKIKIKLNKDYGGSKQTITLNPVSSKRQQIYQKIKLKQSKSAFLSDQNKKKTRNQEQKFQQACEKTPQNSKIIQRIRKKMKDKKKIQNTSNQYCVMPLGENKKQQLQQYGLEVVAFQP